MSLWVPPNVSAELRANTLRHEREVRDAAMRDATLDWWTGELQKIDPSLSMIKARDNANVPGMKPGYFHVLRTGSPPTLFPIEGPAGEFTEPNSSVFDMLRRNDLWNTEAVRDRKRMQRQASEAAQKRRERERDVRVEELLERVKAARETSISMARTRRPWRQSMHRGA